MKGEILRQLVKASGLSAEVVANKLGIGRQHLYSLYKKEEIGGVFADKVAEIGLLKYDSTRQNGDEKKSAASPESADPTIEWYRLDKQRTVENYERQLTELYKVIEDYRALLKRSKVLASSLQEAAQKT